MTASYDKKAKLALIERVGFSKHFQANRWEDYNRQFFNGLAPKYDFLNEILSVGQHQRIKKRALSRTGIRSGERILDLCTGSGDIPLFVSKRYPECRIVGIDVSEKMLETARRKCTAYPNVQFKQADAMNLSFDDDYFDVAFISFGLRNLEDLEQGVREMIRVTKSGGRIVNVDLGKIKGALQSMIYKMYFLKLIPFLGATFFHRGEFNSFHYLPESGKYFPSQERLLEVFKAAGLRDVKNYNYLFGAIAQQIGTVDKKSVR